VGDNLQKFDNNPKKNLQTESKFGDYFESRFSFFKQGPFLLLALSLMVVSLLGFFALFYSPDQSVQFAPDAHKIEYTYQDLGREINFNINNKFLEEVIVEINVIGARGTTKKYIKKLLPGNSKFSLPNDVEKINNIFVDVLDTK